MSDVTIHLISSLQKVRSTIDMFLEGDYGETELIELRESLSEDYYEAHQAIERAIDNA